MLRAVGAVLLAAGPAVIGFHAAERLARRVNVLRELIGALEQMEREIAFRLTPLPELFRHMEEESDGELRTLFRACNAGMGDLGTRSMGRIWRDAVASASLDLEGFGGESVEELGEALGRCDAQGLCGALRHTCGELGRALERAEEERDRKSRMDQVLGLSVGALLVILLI